MVVRAFLVVIPAGNLLFAWSHTDACHLDRSEAEWRDPRFRPTPNTPPRPTKPGRPTYPPPSPRLRWEVERSSTAYCFVGAFLIVIPAEKSACVRSSTTTTRWRRRHSAQYRSLNRMKRYALVLLLSTIAAFSQSTAPAGAWLPVKMKWVHAPRYINPRLETASTLVLYFDTDDHFATVGCVVDREPGRYMTISAGDGQLVSYGNWNGHLPGIVHYRLMSRTVQRIGEGSLEVSGRDLHPQRLFAVQR